MITLPVAPIPWTEFRVSYRDGWNSGATWTVAPAWDNTGVAGVRVVSFSRCCLPEVGEAVIEAPIGIIDDSGINVNLGGEATWTENAYVEAPDLLKKVIRIQARDGIRKSRTASDTNTTANENSNSWHTVFLGVALFQTDDTQSAAGTEWHGIRRWRCLDLLYAYCSQWPMNSHSWNVYSGKVHSGCYGHPGYNVSRSDGGVLGNRSTADTDTIAGIATNTFALPSTTYAATWTDEQAINHAVTAYRKTGDPDFRLTSAATLYSFQQPLARPIADGQSVWDFLVQVCDRRRGIGSVFLDWPDDNDGAVSTPSTITPVLRVYAQNNSDITVTGGTLTGATTNGTAITVDLIGDHRFVDGSLQLQQRDETRVDYLETVGERIEVALTLAYPDSTITRAWSASQETAYAAADQYARQDTIYGDVFRQFNLATADAYIFQAGDGNAGGNARFSYRCADDGTVSAPDVITTSHMTLEIMADLPLLEGWDYETATPASFNNAASPQRRKPLVLARTAAATYDDITATVEMRVTPQGFWISSAGDTGSDLSSYRIIGDTTAGIGSVYEYSSIVVTCGVRLPNRVRYASGDSTSYRRKQIYVPQAHLWLLHKNCILGIDTDGDGSTVVRYPTASDNIVVRDDRARLYTLHQLAWAWYGSDRRSASWQLRCCGLLPTFKTGTLGLSSTSYPKLGYVVTTLKHSGISSAGEDTTMNTPITSIAYDNNSGVTTWSTNWQELDFVGML